MASNDIYVQVTATPESSKTPKSLVVLVPRKNIEDYKSRMPRNSPDDKSIAKDLADPLATNLFTHRASFGNFRVTHSFYSNPLPEIEGKPPEFAHNGLRAWIL
jgi:hypothetical protein